MSLKWAGLKWAGGLAIAAWVSIASVAAQSYPTKPVRIIVPFAVGGPADVYARVIAPSSPSRPKQAFVVDNKPGAGSIVGTAEAAKAAPDGYTLLMMSNTHTTNESLVKDKPFAADARFRRRGAGQCLRPRAGGPPIRAGQDAGRVHRARQGHSRASSTMPRRAPARPITWRASCSKP